jgi:hypothetical protein
VYPTSGSHHSDSPQCQHDSITRTSHSPVDVLADVLQTPQPPFTLDEKKPIILYPTSEEIASVARKKADEERAVLEAMTQSASLPVTPYLGPSRFLSIPHDPSMEQSQYGDQGQMGFGLPGHTIDVEIPMEELPSLDDIIINMEVSGLESSEFGFLDDFNLFDIPGYG